MSARGLPLTLDRLVWPRKVFSLAPAYSSIPPRHNQYDHGVLAASMASTWVTVEVALGNEVVCPGELPVGLSTLLSVVPVHFRLPIGGLVSSLHVHAPLPGPTRPPAVGPVCSELSFHPSEPLCGSACSCHEAPIHFRQQPTARFRASPCARAGPKSCCFRS